MTEKSKLKLWKFHTMPYYNWCHCQRNALQNLQLLLQNANSTYLTEPVFHLYNDKYFSICSHFQGERFWKKYFGKDLGWSQINHIHFLITHSVLRAVLTHQILYELDISSWCHSISQVQLNTLQIFIQAYQVLLLAIKEEFHNSLEKYRFFSTVTKGKKRYLIQM